MYRQLTAWEFLRLSWATVFLSVCNSVPRVQLFATSLRGNVFQLQIMLAASFSQKKSFCPGPTLQWNSFECSNAKYPADPSKNSWKIWLTPVRFSSGVLPFHHKFPVSNTKLFQMLRTYWYWNNHPKLFRFQNHIKLDFRFFSSFVSRYIYWEQQQ